MADKKISALSMDTGLDGTEVVPMVKGGVTKKTSTQAIADLVDLSEKASTALTITAGAGLTGGGDLSTDRTLEVDIAGQSAAAALAGTEKVMVDQSGMVRTTTAAIALLAATLIGAGWFFGPGLDGTPSAMSGVQSALTLAKQYISLTLNAAAELPAAGHAVLVRDTLTMGAGALLRNDGGAGATGVANSTGAAGTAAPAGSLGATGSAGGLGGMNGPGSAGNGGAGGAVDDAMGGASGTAGAGTWSAGAASTVTPPVASTRGFVHLEDLTCIISGSVSQSLTGGAGGPGGGGGASITGGAGGGGGGGGLVLVRAKKLVMGAGAQIRANGGAGGSTACLNSGGGAGGGGGCVVVICDELTITDTYAAHFKADGGAGGVASNGGASGTAGAQGRVFVFVAGKLVYASI